MADQELLVIVRMLDEASAVLAKFAAAVGKQARGLGDAADAADTYAAAIRKVGAANSNALGPTNTLAGALANLTNTLNGQTTALQQTTSWAGMAKQAFATLSSGIISATSNASAITNMANAGQTLGRNLGTAGQALGTFGTAVRTTQAAGGPLSGQLRAIAGAAGRLVPHIAQVAVAYLQLVDAAEPLVAKQDALIRRLSTLTGGQAEAEAYFEGIKTYANATGISIAAATEKAIQFAKAGQGIGISAGNTLGVAVTAEQLTQISGASPQDAEAANQALQKALSSTTVDAENLKTILASVPQIAEQIARGLRVSTGELRQIAETGTLTGRQVFEALRKQSGEIQQSFEKLPQSVESSKQRIANSIDDLTTRLAQWLPGVRLYQQAWAAAADAIEAVTKASFLDDNVEYLKKAIEKQKAYIAGLRKDATPYGLHSLPKAELALENLIGRLDEIEKKKARALALDKAEEFKGTLIGIEADLNKLGLTLDAKTGQLVSLAEWDAAAKVAYWTGVRDRVQKAYDDLAIQYEKGEVSAERVKEAQVALAGAGRLLAEEINNAAKATSEKRAEVSAKEVEEGKTTESIRRVTSSLMLFQDGLDAVAKAALDFAAIARLPFDPASMKPPAWAEQFKGVGIDPMTDPPPECGGSSGVHGSDTLKTLRDELAAISAALKAVSEGAYAIRKAEMETKASRVGTLEGGLQRQVFEGRQVLTDTIAIDNLVKETELTRQLTAAIGDVNKQNEIRQNFEIAKRLRDAAPEKRAEFEKAMRDGNEARKQNEEADKAYKEEQGKMERATAFARETFKGFFTDLKDGLKKGQGLWEAFGNAARNALNKITEKIVDLVSNKLLDQLFEGLGSAIGLGGGGKGGGASGDSGGGGIFDFIGKGLKAFASFLFADGGIMTSRGPVPLRKYSGGGIATSPQLAMFGEGSVPEAYVPVPSGRIPVELRGGGAMRGAMTVQTNISVNMAAPADGQGSGGRGGNMMEQARELGAIVTAMVNKNLQDQMRPGGLLNPSGSFSAGVMQ